MSFDWLEYLDLAQELARPPTGPSSQEARLRSAISRSYYAAFCKARNHLRDKEGDDTIPSGGQVHSYVRNQFMGNSDRVRKKVGENLNQLRIYRNKADYDDIVAGLPATTKRVLKQAKRVISTLGNL